VGANVSCHYDIENWHALYVKTGEEDKVKERLLYRFDTCLKVLVPKRRLRERKGGIWTEITRNLFPGYVLINGNIGIEEYYQIKGTPGLIKLLRNEYEAYSIEPYEIEVLSHLVCNDEIISFSRILIENSKIIVVDGPLISMEGSIISVDARKGRAKVSLNFLGEQRSIELGVSVIQAI
jgi:transcription termination/antitermination protein NusG